MERRKIDFHDFGSVAADIDRLHKNGYDKVGQWELCQTCDHLATVMRMSMEGFPSRGPWYFRKILGPIFKGRFFRKRRMPEGFRAPGFLLPPVGSDEDATVQACKDLLKRVSAYAGEFDQHPFFGKITPEEWRQVHLIHSAHHLSFLIPKG
jgi:hypothetical protein